MVILRNHVKTIDYGANRGFPFESGVHVSLYSFLSERVVTGCGLV